LDILVPFLLDARPILSVLTHELPVEEMVHVELSVLFTWAVGRLRTPLTRPRPPVPRKVSLPVKAGPLTGPLTSSSALAASAKRPDRKSTRLNSSHQII